VTLSDSWFPAAEQQNVMEPVISGGKIVFIKESSTNEKWKINGSENCAPGASSV